MTTFNDITELKTLVVKEDSGNLCDPDSEDGINFKPEYDCTAEVEDTIDTKEFKIDLDSTIETA